jgi:hypothetical protein
LAALIGADARHWVEGSAIAIEPSAGVALERAEAAPPDVTLVRIEGRLSEAGEIDLASGGSLAPSDLANGGDCRGAVVALEVAVDAAPPRGVLVASFSCLASGAGAVLTPLPAAGRPAGADPICDGFADLVASLGAAEALRHAQLALLDRGEPLDRWAAWVVVGD